jgi:hypothetical protein
MYACMYVCMYGKRQTGEVGDGEEDEALSEWRSTEYSAGSAGYSSSTGACIVCMVSNY